MASPVPPDFARRLVERSFAGDPAGPAVLGDLHEDFVRLHRSRGAGAARRWYVREAVLLATTQSGRSAAKSVARHMRPVLGRTLVLTAAGIALGALLSLAVGRMVSSLLYGVRATHPVTFMGMGVVLLAVGAAAGALPALRAARTTGVRALRSDG